MVKYTLIYFNARGRAEVARLLFVQAGVDYEDKRIEQEQWPSLKHSISPSGQLPVLEIDGVKIIQSMAQARYLAREFSLYGSNNMEATAIDMIGECMHDFLEAWGKREALVKAQQAYKVKATQFFTYLNDILAKNGTGFLVGNKVSLADFIVFQYLDMLVCKMFDPTGQLREERNIEFQKYPELAKHEKTIASLPKIKEWIARRPVTDL